MNKIFLSIFLCLSLLVAPTVLAQSNLVINDLENISLDGLTVQNYSGTTQDYDGFGMNFEIRSYNRTQPDFPWTGGVGDAPNVDTSLGNIWFWDYVPIPYIDEDVSNNNPIVVKITTDYIADIRAGDFITLTYDGGQTLDVHLPEIKGRIHKPYFIATDGSTYHDGALTMPVEMKLPISGNENILPDVTEDYVITILTDSPDSDYSDGTYQVQHANWGLMNSNQEIIQNQSWERVYGEYQKNISLTIHQVGEYMLFVVVTQVDMIFSDITGNWTESNETLLVKEVLNVNVKHPITEPTVSIPQGFSNLFASITEWLSGLWTLIFG